MLLSRSCFPLAAPRPLPARRARPFASPRLRATPPPGGRPSYDSVFFSEETLFGIAPAEGYTADLVIASEVAASSSDAPAPAATSSRVAAGERSVLDSRTVDFLVGKGLKGGDRRAVERLLRDKATSNGLCWPLESAQAAWAWLEGVSKGAGWPEERKRNGVATPIVAYLVEKHPLFLYQDSATLQRKWVLLQAPESEGGMGLSSEQAAKMVSGTPHLMDLSADHLLGRLTFLKQRGLDADAVAECVSLFPQMLLYSERAIDAKLELLRQYRLDSGHLLHHCPQLFGFNYETLVDKLRFFLGALRLQPATLQSSSGLFTRSLDGNLRPRLALMLQLGQPLPPPPSGDRKKTPGGNLVTLLHKPPSFFVEYLTRMRHPRVHSLADYERAAEEPGLVAEAARWEAGRVAEAERMGLIPARGLAPSAE